ncbi:hypothetical protein [Bradyrhizobium sp. USDA 3262]|nr:hypothetical protein QIH80_22720 [Bradyrhizobium elkanii]
MDEKMSEWQPIETAPTNAVVDIWIGSTGLDADHSIVKFYCPDAYPVKRGQPMLQGRVTDVILQHRPPNRPGWYPSGGLSPSFPLSPDVRPTHWMKRPAPPKRS